MNCGSYIKGLFLYNYKDSIIAKLPEQTSILQTTEYHSI